jgi:hypothetical protein
MCAERVNWKNEARKMWDKRCDAMAEAIYDQADLSKLAEVETQNGWESVSIPKDSRTWMRTIEREVFFQNETAGEPTVKGRVGTLFLLPGAEDDCATLPVEAWANLGEDGITLHQEVVPFAANERALWKTYYALVQHDDTTLENLGLNVVFDEVKAGLQNEVGADLKDDLLYCLQMLSDMSADALKKHGLWDAYGALDHATQQANAPSGPGGM